MIPAFSRRRMLQASGLGFGSLALAGVMQQAGVLAADGVSSVGAGNNLAPRPGHLPNRARAVIQLFQNGGPSQMDLFDPKPELTRRAGQPHPEKVETFQLDNKNVLLASPFRFRRYGKSGIEMSEIIPHIGSVADEVCLVRSMFTENNNHPFAINMMQTGKTFAGRPAFGSWVCYALGSENQNLPGYVVLRDPAGYNTSGKMVWSSGWLPALYQGTEISASGVPVPHLQPPRPLPPRTQARNMQLLNELNEEHRQAHPGEGELEARIRNFELAGRMQLAAGDLLDLAREPKAVRSLYGLDDPDTAAYGLRCLMARRLVEAGVRFVQVFPPVKPSFQPWDNHGNLKGGLEAICAQVDRPSAALLLDLRQRGLLDEVIVLWTGEFGRLPTTEGTDGRDHNRHAFSLFLAGGGFKRGHVHGATDEFGYRAIAKRISVPDLHATLLQQLGLDHTQLSYVHQGRPERLTDPEVTHARIVGELLQAPMDS